MKILVVEDNLLISQSLSKITAEFGKTFQASSLDQAEELLDHHFFEIILLDRHLPDGDGLNLLDDIKQFSPKSKVLIVTELGDIQHRLQGWQLGSDDYICKPFVREEVKLRIKRLINLEKKNSNNWQKIGDLKFNQNNGELYTPKGPAPLRPKEFLLFVTLWRFRGHTVTKSQLIDNVWGTQTSPSFTTLDVYIRRIRMHLQSSIVKIVTTRGFGYSLIWDKNS